MLVLVKPNFQTATNKPLFVASLLQLVYDTIDGHSGWLASLAALIFVCSPPPPKKKRTKSYVSCLSHCPNV